MFDEIVVIDYITNINSLTTDQRKKLDSSVINSFFLDDCPDGTIIGRPVSGEENLQNRVYYPFFSHVRFPVKAGERAWAFNQGSGLVSYWITRKVQDASAEDINFTHFDREKIYNRIKDTTDARKSNSEKFPDTNSSGINLKNTRKDAISRSEFAGEPVVSIKNKSVDLTIQGSNGTAIKMSSDGGAGYGTIDIVAGPATNNDLTTIAGLSVLNTEGYQEAIKPPALTDLNSLTIGALRSDDESRITISRLFNADEYYSLTGDNAGSQKSITLKTDNVRIIAQNDLKIVVGTSSDPSSIILKSDGNIIITPSSTGVIKLGGEDASGAILATTDSIVTAGVVTAPSLVSTAGGILGAPGLPATGIFSTKVLVKVS